jgi:transposase
MSAAYISAIDAADSQVTKIFDRFHVQALASDAVDEVRRSEVRRLAGTEEAKFIKDSRYSLLKNPWNLTRRQGQRLREIQANNKTLYRAYLLKESLAKAFDYLQPARAEKAFREWISWAKHSHLEPFKKLAGTIERHFEGILAYTKTRLTNGLTEGLNNMIRLITRRAFGFHSAPALQAIIQLVCGKIPLDPPLPMAH